MGALNYSANGARLAIPTQAATDSSGNAASTAFVQALVPAGVVFPYSGSVIPTGWLLADGSSLLRSAYPALFNNIGTTFGSADGTHFNLPDLRGEFLRGLDNARGVDASRALGSFQADQMQSHTHAWSTTAGSNFNQGQTDLQGLQSASSGSASQLIAGTNANAGGTTNNSENRPRNVALNFIIKAQ